MNTSLLIGIAAGLTSSALFASAWTGTALGVLVLFFLSPMPVAIAGLGWGWASGAAAAAAGTAIVGAIGGARSGIVYVLALGAPAAVFAYLTLLNRTHTYEAEDNSLQQAVEWYPLGRLVGWAAVWAGVLAAMSMLSIGTDVAALRTALGQVMDKSIFSDAASTTGRAMTEAEKSAFVNMMTQLYPWAVATMWMVVAMLNWWIAGLVTARSGKLIRPWPDLASLTLPPQVTLAFGLSLLATLLLSGIGMLIASGFTSGFMFALMLVGLGILHRVTRGSGGRPFMLGLVYSALLVLPFTSLIIALIGLAEPYLRGRLANKSGGGSPT